MKTPILVTGARGFLGRPLVERLLGEAIDPGSIFGFGRGQAPKHLATPWIRGDVTDRSSLLQAVEAMKPRTVFHLAGQTPPASEADFEAVNVRGTEYLLSALAASERPARVIVVGSAAELGRVEPDRLPVVEEHPCRPVDAYGRSKYVATSKALAANKPLEVSVARVFNPIGPGLPESQAFGRFAASLARSREDRVQLTVGDLSPKRDFIDVRDVADALVAIAERGRSGRLYHVATGRSRSIEEGLSELIRLSGRSVAIVEDANRLNAAGPSDSRGDVSRIADEVGFRPRIPWEQSLFDLWTESLERFGSD